ncbi:MAG: DNA-3-methyladenine glycosylase I [Prevotellaceae bacterium]|jgi:DNA-3-methyladenine glycosylase I|nr:DNA-3-methyladenine glycosylase I [Prevotellaceae bacterium]
MSYCTYIDTIEPEEKRFFHKSYHDNFYGFPIHNDNELFGRLVLEINQAGLSWETILKKEAAFREAYDNFDIAKIANYAEEDISRLLGNPKIIRNKLKIRAAIENAGAILRLQKEYGSFEKWLEANHPMAKEEWVKLFKRTFKFTGGEIVGEFLMSIGYLPGAHDTACPVYRKILAQNPMWNANRAGSMP